MIQKVALSFSTISRAIRTFPLPETDWVVGIGRGGVVPACLLAHQLQCGLTIIQLNYRDDDNRPAYEAPVWIRDFTPDDRIPDDRILDGRIPDFTPDARILLVDDVSVSGKTLQTAKERLAGFQVTTMVLKGKADLVLFPQLSSCVDWPWKAVDYAI